MSTSFDPSRAAAAPAGGPGPAAAVAAPRSASASRSLSWVDRLTLGAIGLVVVLVTLPVLRRFGLRENERDAVRTLRVLSAEPGSRASRDPRERPFALADLALANDTLRRRLEDLEPLSDGRLRRHGYLFDVTRLPSGEPLLVAWPWEHGHTGSGAFAWTPARGLLGHANRDGRFGGPEAPPLGEDLDDDDWVPLRRR
ncbi:MAG: hypothetical protein JNK02_15585 [Planctomycetes bacterium]|nr:hypothetical protein [Planctomycetota bacterium]